MNFVQILLHKQTVWTRPSLTQPFKHRLNITKQLFCFQLKWKARPRKSSKSLNSSFLSATLPSSQLAGIWPHCILGNLSVLWAAKTNLKPIWYFFYSLWPGFNNAINVFQSLPSLNETSIFVSLLVEAWWDKGKGPVHLLRGPFSMDDELPCSSWNKASGRSLSHSQCQ